MICCRRCEILEYEGYHFSEVKIRREILGNGILSKVEIRHSGDWTLSGLSDSADGIERDGESRLYWGFRDRDTGIFGMWRAVANALRNR